MRPACLALVVVIVGLRLASCSADPSSAPAAAPVSGSATAKTTPTPRNTAVAQHTVRPASGHPVPGVPLPSPVALVPFGQPASAGQGSWRPGGQAVGGVPTV